MLLTIKNTTLNHKLIVVAAQTFLRGRNNLTGWGKPQVGGDKDFAGEEEEAVILKLVKQQIEAARCSSGPTIFSQDNKPERPRPVRMETPGHGSVRAVVRFR